MMHKTWIPGMLVMVMVMPGGLANETGPIHEGDESDLICIEIEDFDDLPCVQRGPLCIWGQEWTRTNPILEEWINSAVDHSRFKLVVRTLEANGFWYLPMTIEYGANCAGGEQAAAEAVSCREWQWSPDIARPPACIGPWLVSTPSPEHQQ